MRQAYPCPRGCRYWLTGCLVVIALTQAAKADGPNPPPAGKTPRVWLTDLPERNVKVGWGSFGKHGQTGFGSGPISVEGMSSIYGLGLHPDGQVEYVLEKRYRTFRGTAAMDDSADPPVKRPVVFRVLGNGRLLWESRGMH